VCIFAAAKLTGQAVWFLFYGHVPCFAEDVLKDLGNYVAAGVAAALTILVVSLYWGEAVGLFIPAAITHAVLVAQEHNPGDEEGLVPPSQN